VTAARSLHETETGQGRIETNAVFKVNGILRGAAISLAVAGLGVAQTSPVTIEQAVEQAAKNYPAIRASMSTVTAAESGIELAKTAYLPRTDFHYQVNRATRNNIFGLTFPNTVIAPISGPPVVDQAGTSTFGTAVGLAFRWEPFDLGLRKSLVDLANRVRAQAAAGQDLTEYEVKLAAADAFFNVLAATQAATAARANVQRMEVFTESVGALVRAELRPGADSSRAQAELARARNELIGAERVVHEQRLLLGRWMGRAGTEIEISAGALLMDPPVVEDREPNLATHPVAAAQAANIYVIRARRESIAKEYRPKFELLSTTYGRATGARNDGAFQGGANGLAPNIGNWAVGFGVSFPLFDYKQNRVRREIESHRETAEGARLDEILERLKSEAAQAQVSLEAARQIASNTPTQLTAAQTLERQAQARYQTGLGTVVEVADGQRLLRQAETDGALAKLGIWRALFTLQAAKGDLAGVLAQGSR